MTVAIVGYFGTQFSYATHASMLARALRDEGMLGRLYNLDPGLHPAYDELQEHFQPGGPKDAVGLVIARPDEHTKLFAGTFSRSVLFVCPNTDELSDEAIDCVRAFDCVIVPSIYCSRVVTRACPEQSVVVIPLGAHAMSDAECSAAMDARMERMRDGRPADVLHCSTDFFQPGRKGTFELLEAWRRLAIDPERAVLTVHAPIDAADQISYRARDLGLRDAFRLELGPERGMGRDELVRRVAAADVMIQPSRCEGYGMLIAQALLLGVPLMATRCTGHWDYMGHFQGAYVECPIGGVEELAGEPGVAPTVPVEGIAKRLPRVLDMKARFAMIEASATLLHSGEANFLRWERALKLWVRFLAA